ncbi:MAG: hypothetical protein WBG48_00615 [Pricia sp.]
MNVKILLNPVFGLRASGFGLRASGFGLRASGFGLRTSDFGLRTSDFKKIAVFPWKAWKKSMKYRTV